MATLDYAYLADYAAVESGKLTAVGASFTHLRVPALPQARLVSIAGRARLPEAEDGFELSATISAPEGQWSIRLEGYVDAPDAEPYDGKKGILFAAQAMVTLTGEGLYVVEVFLDGESVRTLKFDVSVG